MGFEKRGVRPFDSMDRTQTMMNQMVRLQCPPIPDGFQPNLGGQALRAVGVPVPPGEVGAPGGTLLLDRDQYIGDAIGLYFATNDADWQTLTSEAGREIDRLVERRSDVSVVITLTNTRLKQLETLSSISFADWASGGWRYTVTKRAMGEDRPRTLRMPEDGCVLGVRILLAHDIPEERRRPGLPWRKGSWLARVDVNISSARDGGLLPRPMNATVRERFGLPEHSTLFVDVRGEVAELHSVSDLADVLTVYVDEELLMGALEQNEKAEFQRPAGGSLANRWVLDTYMVLIGMYSRDPTLDEFDPSSDDSKRTFLYSLLTKVAESCRLTIDEALLILKEQPNKFASLLEHVLEVRKTDHDLLELRK